MPYYVNGNESEPAKLRWQTLHDRLSMELGVAELAPKYYSYQTMHMGKPHNMSGSWTVNQICKTFMTAEYSGPIPADRFVKDRLSFVELAFRMREEELAKINSDLPAHIAAARLTDARVPPGRGMRIPGSRVDGVQAYNQTLNREFSQYVNELNERLRRAGTQLNYHNGFIQVATDQLVEDQIEHPFWELVSDPIWKNVDRDMKEALDLRDSNGRDPAWYAARALEGAIKIICERNGWATGKESGAQAYVDHLANAKNGPFVKAWEQDALRAFFKAIRNPLAHAAGSADMPELTTQQTDWAIENCMSWIRSLVLRMSNQPRP
jgi:hypothetical protein